MKLFVGNLAWDTSESELLEHFQPFGKVLEVSIKLDCNHLPSFAFVEFANEHDAQTAMTKLNGQQFEGRALNVALAHRQ